MRSIRINNPVLDTYLTDLAADYSSGVTATVKNTNSFQDNDLVVFGEPGSELTELKKVSTVTTPTTFTLASALSFSHNKGTPLYKSLWDYVSIEGRSTSAGVFAEISQSAIQWDSQSKKTIYLHSAGSDTWEYRFRFYNSVTGLYSEYSPTLSGAGFNKYQLGYIIKMARLEAGDREGKILSVEELLEYATYAKNVIRAHNPRYWFWKVNAVMQGTSITGVTTSSVYSLADIPNFGTIDFIEYEYTNSSPVMDVRYVLKKRSEIEFLALTRNQKRPVFDFPRFYRLLPPDNNSANGYFEIERKLKTDGVGTFYPSYYMEENDYDSVDDRTKIWIPEIIESFLVSKIYAAKGNQDKAEKYYDMFIGPQGRQKTLPLEKLSGIALLDELDRQHKSSQSQPQSLWRFRGQKAMSKLFGNRHLMSPDDNRINFFQDER